MRSSIIVCFLLMLGTIGAADPPRPFPEFTFKRITPPGPEAGRRITVQIDPSAQQAQPAPVAPTVRPTPVSDPQVAAFWEALSVDIAAASPARLEEARRHLSQARFAGPSLQTLQQIAATHGRTVLAQSIGTGVSPALALAVIAVESSGRPDAVSRAGAQGLMQLIPATADRFDVADAFDPAQNIAGGMAYLSFLLDRFEGDALLALAGYNAGENAVLRAGGVPDFAETRAYVPKVIAAWDVARSLCLTPPELPSDGCVFGVIAAN